MSGLPKVTYVEDIRTVYPVSTTGAPLLVNIPANKGDLGVKLISSPNQLFREYTEFGKMGYSDYTQIFEAAKLCEKNNMVWVHRVSNNALLGGIAVYAESNEDIVTRPFSLGLAKATDYSMDTVDGRAVLGATEVTFDAEDCLTVSDTSVFELIETGTPVNVKGGVGDVLPVPLNDEDTYYVIKLRNGKIKLATSESNARLGIAVDIETEGITTDGFQLVNINNIEAYNQVAAHYNSGNTFTIEDTRVLALVSNTHTYLDGKEVYLKLGSTIYRFKAWLVDADANTVAFGSFRDATPLDFTATPYSLTEDSDIEVNVTKYLRSADAGTDTVTYITSNVVEFTGEETAVWVEYARKAQGLFRVGMQFKTVPEGANASILDETFDLYFKHTEDNSFEVYPSNDDTDVIPLQTILDTLTTSLGLGEGVITATANETLDVYFVLKQDTVNSMFTPDLSSDYITYQSSAAWSQLITGDKIQFSAVGGSLPAPLQSDVEYFAYKDSSNGKAKVCATYEDAINHHGIDITGQLAEGVVAYVENKSTYVVEEADQPVFILFGKNPGAWNNNLSIRLYNKVDLPLQIKDEDVFKLEVYQSGVKVEEFMVSRNPERKIDGVSAYIQNVLMRSEYIDAIDNAMVPAVVIPHSVHTLATFTGGDNGNAITDGDMIRGLDALRNSKRFQAYYISDLGWDTDVYKKALVDFAEQQDVFAELSVPYAQSTSANALSDLLDWFTSFGTASSYAGMNNPWCTMYDIDNDRYLKVSPSTLFLTQELKVGANNIMTPAFGAYNGQVNPYTVETNLTEEEMGVLYDNYINSVVNLESAGYVIFGIKTMLRNQTPLAYKPARMTLLWLKRNLTPILQSYLGRQLDYGSRDAFIEDLKYLIEGVFSEAKAKKGIYSGSVEFPQDTIARDIQQHKLRIRGTVSFMSYIEEIEFTITSSAYQTTISVG